MSRKQTPSEFLKQIIGRPVVVKLNSGVDYRGFLNYKLSKKYCIEITFTLRYFYKCCTKIAFYRLKFIKRMQILLDFFQEIVVCRWC